MQSHGKECRNALGQPVGFELPGWSARQAPPRLPMEGRSCRLVPLDADQHAEALFEANAIDHEGRNWTYMAYGPFESLDHYRAWVQKSGGSDDPLFFAVLHANGKAVGVVSFMRIDRANGVIEIGHLAFSPLMQRTPMATEAIFVMLRRIFDELGYRRCEWKCDSLNAPSRAAAERFGFTYEGIFRHAVVVKGRNRDTAWYSIIDSEWPAIRSGFDRWLSPENFQVDGRQRERLHELIQQVRDAS